MPGYPDKVYQQEGWHRHGHWLGTGAVAPKDHQFLPFKEALLLARSLELKSKVEWMQWSKSGTQAVNMPSNPERTYRHHGWQGYGHWLGISKVGVKKDHQFLPFKEALLHARSLKLKDKKEWWAWSQSGARPANIPSSPDQVYKHDDWQGYGHWLGTGNVGVKKVPAVQEGAAARTLGPHAARVL